MKTQKTPKCQRNPVQESGNSEVLCGRFPCMWQSLLEEGGQLAKLIRLQDSQGPFLRLQKQQLPGETRFLSGISTYKQHRDPASGAHVWVGLFSDAAAWVTHPLVGNRPHPVSCKWPPWLTNLDLDGKSSLVFCCPLFTQLGRIIIYSNCTTGLNNNIQWQHTKHTHIKSL